MLTLKIADVSLLCVICVKCEYFSLGLLEKDVSRNQIQFLLFPIRYEAYRFIFGRDSSAVKERDFSLGRDPLFLTKFDLTKNVGTSNFGFGAT